MENSPMLIDQKDYFRSPKKQADGGIRLNSTPFPVVIEVLLD